MFRCMAFIGLHLTLWAGGGGGGGAGTGRGRASKRGPICTKNDAAVVGGDVRSRGGSKRATDVGGRAGGHGAGQLHTGLHSGEAVEEA